MVIGIFTELIVKPINCAITGQKVNIDASAVFNPYRAAHNCVQMAQSNHANRSSHIWIGRRCLGDGNFLGLSLVPGVDVYHWAIGIEGYIYEINVNGTRRWIIQRNGRVESEYGTEFEWFRINEGRVQCTREELRAKADSLAGRDYCLTGDNCQEFCKLMLAHAMNVSKTRACWMLDFHVGTYFF